MAKEIFLTQDLKDRFRRLGMAEDDIRELVGILSRMKDEVHAAAGDPEGDDESDEVGPKIKEMFGKIDPGLRGLVKALASSVGMTGEKGTKAHELLSSKDEENKNIVDSAAGNLGESSGGGKR